MTNFLQTGATWLAGQLAGSVSVSVTYYKGGPGGTAIPLSATLGSKLLRMTDRNGVTRTERSQRDFIVQAADLAVAGVTFLPARGDEIRLVKGTVTERWAVIAQDNDATYQDMDHQGTLLRVHTKYLGTV